MNNDIKGQHIQDIDPKLLKLFLSDKTTKKYLRWGSDNYIGYGEEYGADQEMSPELVIRSYEFIIQSRVIKTEEDATINEIPCKIFDWRAKRSVEFGSIVRGK